MLTPTTGWRARVERGLRASGRFFDAQLRQAIFHGAGHASHRLDLLDVAPGLRGEIVR